MVDARTVLDLYLTPDHHIKIDVDPFADDTLLTDARSLPDLRLVPDLCSCAN
jgi:hypothetical protein